MKHYRYLFIIAFTLTLVSRTSGQDLVLPSQGKSMVYFVRSIGAGAVGNFKYFDGENYLGKFNYKNYLLYECDPGEHLFWVTAENRGFVEATLLPDKVYIIEVRPTVGAFKSALKLIPLANDNLKDRKRLFKLMTKMEPVRLGMYNLSAEQEDLSFYVENGMKKYRSDKEKGKAITQLPESHGFN